MHTRRLRLLAIALLLPLPAIASPETDELRAEIKALEARLNALEQKEAQAQQPPQQAAQATPSPAPTVPAAQTAQNAAELAPAAPAPAPHSTVDYNDHGLFFSSADGEYKLHMQGYIQADNHTFFDNHGTSNVDQWYIRSARPIFEAQFPDQLSARLMMDFGNGQTQLLDAYMDYKPDDAVNFRLGKFKAPLGLERAQSEQEILFVERALPTNLVPFRDNGLQLYGTPIPQVDYQLTLTDGAPDLANPNGDTDNPKDISGRLFAHPFKDSGADALEGLGAGLAGSFGGRTGSPTNQNLPAGFRTMSQATFFSYSGTTYAAGPQWRFNPQAMYYNGPLGLLGEYVLEQQDVKNGANEANLHNDAWMAVATYVLTGENASFDGVRPRYNFDPRNGHWGAFELAARYDVLDVDKNAFPNFANLSSSASSAREWAAGINWYLNYNVKFNLDYAYTTFDGGAPDGLDRRPESVLMTRAQFRY